MKKSDPKDRLLNLVKETVFSVLQRPQYGVSITHAKDSSVIMKDEFRYLFTASKVGDVVLILVTTIPEEGEYPENFFTRTLSVKSPPSLRQVGLQLGRKLKERVVSHVMRS